MADGVSVFYSAVRKKDSVIHFVIRLFTDCSIFYLLHVGSILRMHALQPVFPSRQALFWIKPIDAIPFLGEIQGVPSWYPPGPTPRMREPLRFCQITLAPPQCFLRQLSFGDVHHGAHELAGLAGRFDEGVTYSVHVSRGPVRENDSEMRLDISSCAHCSLEISDGPASIVRMNALIKLFE